MDMNRARGDLRLHQETLLKAIIGFMKYLLQSEDVNSLMET